ncbi:hypothetical protein [Stenotrophomonas sp. NLF4-10]|uniref:hypothetical protein n=1 Tax=Stenotrophomonas sp. NLF4-10 TaxID=2918754 RepID=UPI001EFC11C0|nr:hypothetical protein [Stenotrophomonas sp. NLF4-10]MCG8276798.1 hypothetical protein [Stenotrophomonas sp. NLF4-10]
MRLRHLPGFLPTRRQPTFANADHGPRRDNSLNPLHFAALREVREPAGAGTRPPALRRLAAFLAAALSHRREKNFRERDSGHGRAERLQARGHGICAGGRTDPDLRASLPASTGC